MSKLSAWIKQKGRPFQVSAKNGKGTIKVQFYDGYVTIVGTQPGTHHYQQELHLTHSAWLQLLRQISGPTRLMEGPDFDRYRAERVYYRRERELLEGLRQEKRDRRQGQKGDAQHRRWLRAQRRAQQRADATE